LKIENMSLSPLETRRFTFTESSSQPISGYLVLEHSRQIAPSVRYEGRDVAAEVVESVGVIPHEHLTSHAEFLIDVIYEDMTDTGIALVPDMVEQIESGEVLAVLYDDSGNRIEETLISTGKHYSKFISEIFPGIEKPFSGYLLIHHGGTYDKVHALALLIEYRSGGWELTSLPLHPQN